MEYNWPHERRPLNERRASTRSLSILFSLFYYCFLLLYSCSSLLSAFKVRRSDAPPSLLDGHLHANRVSFSPVVHSSEEKRLDGRTWKSLAAFGWICSSEWAKSPVLRNEPNWTFWRSSFGIGVFYLFIYQVCGACVQQILLMLIISSPHSHTRVGTQVQQKMRLLNRRLLLLLLHNPRGLFPGEHSS